MHMTTKYFVRFFSPGSLVANDWTAPVDTLDPCDVVWPDRAYAFTLYERTDIVSGSESFKGEAKQVGPMYYHPASKVVTLDEIAAKGDPADEILLWNMRVNEWTAVVYSRWGTWPQPYNPKEGVIL